MEERNEGRSFGVTFSLNKNVKETNYRMTIPFFHVIELSYNMFSNKKNHNIWILVLTEV